MPKNKIERNINRNLLFLTICMVLLLGYPLFSIAHKLGEIGHIPIKILYVFAVWAGAIFISFSILNRKNE
jgi:hypothetical protein